MGPNGNGRTREQMSEDMKRYHKRKRRHVHSWVWDGIGGRCACGADITNEEAAMIEHETWCHAHPMSGIGPCNCEFNQPDAFISERLDYGVQQLKWADTLAENAALKAEVERLQCVAMEIYNERERLTASLATARADALEEAARMIDGFAASSAAKAEDPRMSPDERTHYEGMLEAAEDDAAQIRRLKGGPPRPITPGCGPESATDSPTGPSPEKTTPGSPEPQTAPSAPLSASVPYREF